MSLTKLSSWWPILLGPVAMTVVYLVHFAGYDSFASRSSNENIALLLLSMPAAGFAALWYVRREGFYLFFACLSVAFFCREWHFAGTSKGIYVALAALGYWWYRKGKEFETIMATGALRIWVWSTFATYLLSQLVARRVFRYLHLPMEARLHVPLEETVETTAHLMLILTCVIAAATRRLNKTAA